MASIAEDTMKGKPLIGHNLPTAREWLHAVLHSGEVTRVGQHLALVIFHSVDEKGRLEASVRDLERITGWGRQTIADHLGELKVFMSVQLGVGRAKSVFDLQCKISRALNELRIVRQTDTTRACGTALIVHEADTSVQQPDTTTVRETDAMVDTNVASTSLAVLPDTKPPLSRARIESSLREDSYTLEAVSEEKKEGGAGAPSPRDALAAFEAYNELAQRVGLPLAKTLTPERRKAIQRRMRDNGGTDCWASLLSNIECSAFLQGENDRGWRVPGLDWLLKPANFVKVIEGTYGNGAHATAPKESEFDKIGRLVRKASENQQQRRVT